MQYYLFALSNFLAAFGGGMILGKGIGTIDISFLHASSIFAFFIGSVLGLALLQFFPKKWASFIPSLFSTLAALTSVILLLTFKSYEVDGQLSNIPAIIFFSLLCIRFGFWFYSRVLRASLAAGKQQKIAWVESGNFVGMIFGLIIWKFIGLMIGIIAALALDACLQISAGLLDLVANQIKTEQKENIAPTEAIFISEKVLITSNGNWFTRLAFAVGFLTIGVQVIIFSLAHELSEWFSSYIIASYYLGVSIAAIVCRKFKVQFDWDFTKGNKFGYAAIIANTNNRKRQISLLAIGVLPIISVIITILIANYGSLGNPEINIKAMLLLLFITISAFLYETLALSLLDRIGLEEKQYKKSGMIIKTYGLMAVVAAVSLWLLSLTKSTIYDFSLTLIICIAITILTLWKRSKAST